MPRRPRPTLVALAAAGALAVPAVGIAHAATTPNPTTTQVTVADRDDTEGPLDVQQAVHVLRSDDTVVYKIRTYTPFDVGDLSRTKRTVVIELDTDGEPGSERNIRVSAPAGRLRAELISNATRETIKPVAVQLLGKRTLRLSGPRADIGARKYFWVTTYHFGGDPITRQDVVPDRGWIRQR
ncbi:hypothetical protein [Solicola sp. PLA-1-18]|uniref:hypothetical protein n=1 Tax=Solicola sp. PLA-1-18 TaxID=3380532 RepID=UPI003B7DEEA3